MENRESRPVSVGVCILFVIFLSVCFFVLSAISLRTAGNNLDSATSYGESVRAYYAACNEAEERLADNSADQSFAVTIDDSRELIVETDASGEVTRWQVSPTGEWEESKLNVLQ